MGDDSGLEVDALGGAPGVWSARYAGEPTDSAANVRKLLAEMGDTENRSARFRCAIALASSEGETRVVEGACEGVIGFEERGCSGFGYDPVFMPEGHDRTFAEMPAEEKNAISHRGRALAAAAEAWGNLLTDLG